VLFLPNLYRGDTTLVTVMPLLLTGPLLVLNLYLNPGGLSEMAFGVRDRFLRRVAQRAGLVVASLLADRRVDDATSDTTVDTGAPDALMRAASGVERAQVEA
jgi:hypothetical protein